MTINNYVYFLLSSVVTRANVVCFSLPTVAPSTDEEEAAFAEIEDLLFSGELSSAIGWAISVGKQLSCCREEIRELKKLTQLQGRSSQNWAILLFFVKRVRRFKVDCNKGIAYLLL